MELKETILTRPIKMQARHIPIPEGCWMCGATGVKMSDEHIFPLWLLESLNNKNVLYYSTHEDRTGRIIDRRKVPLGKFVCGRVCKIHCNEGWMSDLEKAVKKIYQQGWKKSVDENRVLLARWLAKTATTLNVSQQFRVMVPSSARHGLRREDKLPKGWSVYIFECSTKEPAINWIQGGSIIAVNASLSDSKIVQKIFRCGLKLGNLGAMVYWMPPGVKEVKPARGYKQIWPDITEGLPKDVWDINTGFANQAYL